MKNLSRTMKINTKCNIFVILFCAVQYGCKLKVVPMKRGFSHMIIFKTVTID